MTKTRQPDHQQIIPVWEQKFPERKTTHPAVLALLYTKAGNIVQAIRYWDEVGRKADEPYRIIKSDRQIGFQASALSDSLSGSGNQPPLTPLQKGGSRKPSPTEKLTTEKPIA